MNNQNSQDDQDWRTKSRWHLDKKVPLSLIVVVIIQGAGGIWVIADIKKDVEVLKAAYAIQLDRDSRQDKAASEAVALVREDLKEVKSMLSYLIGRQGRSDK